jgi:hypothetical protein
MLALLGEKNLDYVTHRELQPAVADLAVEWVDTDAGADLARYDGVWVIPGPPCGSAPFSGYHYCGYGLAEAFAGALAGEPRHPLIDAFVTVTAGPSAG